MPRNPDIYTGVEGTPIPLSMPKVSLTRFDSARNAVEKAFDRKKRVFMPSVDESLAAIAGKYGQMFADAVDEGMDFYAPNGESFLAGLLTVRLAIQKTDPSSPPLTVQLVIDWRSPTTNPDMYQDENPVIMNAIRATSEIDKSGAAFRAGAMIMYEVDRIAYGLPLTSRAIGLPTI